MNKTKPLNNNELSSFFTQLAILSDESHGYLLDLMLEDTTDERGREMLTQMRDNCYDNMPLHQAMRETGVFPDYAVRMIALGETVSKEAEMAQSLADYYDRQQNIADGIKNAVSYPMIMIFMMLLVIVVLITKVLPIFSQVFEQLGSQMNSFSTGLMNIGKRLSSSSVILVVLLCVILLLFVFFAKVPQGKRIVENLLTKLPATKKFYTAIDRSRFASSLAMTFAQANDTYEALDMAAELVNTPEMYAKVEATKDMIMEGSRIGDAINKAGIFSNFHSRMITVGFENGDPSPLLIRIADDCDREVDKRLHNLISVLEPTLVIILSLIVGMILLSVILPLMGIMSSIG